MTAKASRIRPALRERVYRRDQYRCVGGQLGWKSHQREAHQRLELDHVRASHGLGMKSETTEQNLVSLCGPGGCHDWKTRNGREARAALLVYLARFYGVTA